MSEEKAMANDSLTTLHLQRTLTTAHYKQPVQNQQSGQSQNQGGQSGNSGSQPSSQEK
jgi:hypothetical protein